MENEWSNKWVSSSQPRKQRKYRHNAPLHVKRKFLSTNLSKPLRERYNKRSMVVRKGDEVIVMRGQLKGTKGLVDKVDTNKECIFLENVKMKKVDGSQVAKPLVPSNLMIIKLSLDDKRRQVILERVSSRGKKEEEKGE